MSDPTEESQAADATAEEPRTEGAAMPSWMPGALDEESSSDAASPEAASHEGDEDAAADTPQDDPDALDIAEDDVEGAAPGEGEEFVIALEAKTRAADAEDLVNLLRDAPSGATLVIDARAVEDISTPALAAIVATLRSRAERTPPAAVLAPTSAFVDAFSDLGLFQDLMKMEFRQ